MNIRQIAKLAGVSPATVSLVLNDREVVGEATRQRVWQVLQEYGYTPPRRNARKKHSGLVRFIAYRNAGELVERNGDFIARVMEGVENAAHQMGYDLLVRSATRERLPEEIEACNGGDTDGVILLGTEFAPDQIGLLKTLQVPCVAVDNALEHTLFDAVVMDNAQGAYMAVDALRELGHRRIGYLQSSLGISNFIQRSRGYHQAMQALGLVEHPGDILTLRPTLEGAYADASALLATREGRLPGAFFADNDTIALGALRAFKAAGYRIPQDISIIGFDNIAACQVAEPPLSTVHIYKQRMGRFAVERLVQQIRRPTGEYTKLLVGAKLILRGSTAPAAVQRT